MKLSFSSQMENSSHIEITILLNAHDKKKRVEKEKIILIKYSNQDLDSQPKPCNIDRIDDAKETQQIEEIIFFS